MNGHLEYDQLTPEQARERARELLDVMTRDLDEQDLAADVPWGRIAFHAAQLNATALSAARALF